MLPYALAITVGLSSSFLFVTAFFLRDIHRQDDFLWSGVGLFYALVLWFCATSITGAVLLGQLAVVALLTAYFWQVIKLRKAIANPEKQSSLDSFSVVSFLQNLFKRSSPKTSEVKATNKTSKNKPLTSSTETVSPSQATSPNIVSETIKSSKSETATVADNSSEEKKKADSATEQEPFVTTTKVNETVEVANNTSETPSETATSKAEASAVETTVSPDRESEPSITEIAVENVTVVEEETNWDDEVDDVPASSVKVIEEVATPPDNESESETPDNSSPETKEDLTSEVKDAPE